MKARFLVSASASLLALLACGVRGSDSDTTNRSAADHGGYVIGSAKQAISGGTDTTSYPYAVGIKIGNAGRCSGTLIAKNLVLTARHCVSTLDTGETIDSTSTFNANYTASTFGVTTNATMGNGSGGYRTVSEVLYPSSNKAMGNDIALLVLSTNVPAAEATPATPVVQHAVFNFTRYSYNFTAIGYGITGPGLNDSGQRRIRQDIKMLCLDGSQNPGGCANITDGQGNRAVMSTEFLTGAGVCKGDSGSGAFPQKNFNAAGTIYTYGVLSRGPESSCDNAIYTRTDSHRAFIIAGAMTAAAAGGYAAPSWTATEAQDPDDVPYTPTPKDAGKDTGKKDGATLAGFGETCAADEECSSGLCRTIGDGTVCSQACSKDNPCPDGYVCNAEVCGAPPVDAGSAAKPNTAAEATTTSSCTLDPTKPTPWRGSVVFGLIAVSVLVRRRSRG